MNLIKLMFNKRVDPVDKHDCRENRELIEKLPLFESDSLMGPYKRYCGNTYNVRCKVCGMDWWQNHP